MATKIMKCSCKSEFQDQQYGEGMRVFNQMGKDHKDSYRCTICGKEVCTSGAVKKK